MYRIYRLNDLIFWKHMSSWCSLKTTLVLLSKCLLMNTHDMYRPSSSNLYLLLTASVHLRSSQKKTGSSLRNFLLKKKSLKLMWFTHWKITHTFSSIRRTIRTWVFRRWTTWPSCPRPHSPYQLLEKRSHE